MVALGGMHGCSGGHAWLLRGACVVAPGGMRGCSGGGACMVAPGCVCMVAPGGGCAWDTTRYGDTVDERAVRILLECILVRIVFTVDKQWLLHNFTVNPSLTITIIDHR